MKKFIFTILYWLFINNAIAQQFSLSPSTTAQREMELRELVNWQTGCAKPDLSKSPKGGEATLNVFLKPDGGTKTIEIVESTGTQEDNDIIINTFQECDFSSRSIAPAEFPTYFYKKLKFTWGPGNNKPLIGLKRCMRRTTYPATALIYKLEGTVTWKVRPISDGSFEKKLITESISNILIRNSKSELEKCLNNPIVAKSIRDNFKDGNWDEFQSTYKLQK